MRGNNIAILNKKACTGCGACYNICPIKAIDMSYDDEGFPCPEIKSTCINCGKCVDTCPQLKKQSIVLTSAASYAVQCKEKIREKCSSGGVFGAIAEHVIDIGGVVYGAAFNSDFTKLLHIGIKEKKDLKLIYKSKYLQSEINDSFREIKEKIESGKMVAFCGCPCQVDGLKSFLGKNYDNLLTIDILCHGVPSPLAYRVFLKEVANGKEGRITGVDFRDKKFGWGKLLSVSFEQGLDVHYDYYNGNYMRAFSKGFSMRECCFGCRYAQINRVGDITLGDFWGIKQFNSSLDDGKGTSLVICNTKKGEDFFKNINKDINIIKAIHLKEVIKISEKNNGALIRPTYRPQMRDCFFYHIKKGDSFSKSLRYAETSLLDIGIVGWWIETKQSNYGSTLTDFALYKHLLAKGLSVAFVSPPGFDREYAGEFNKRNCYRMTAKYTAEKMGENNKYIDTFIVASDVLWYYDAFIKTGFMFMLDFVDDKKKKISYSTSFGNTKHFFPKEERLKAQLLLNKFDSVSVREYEAVDICKNCFGVSATHVLDPVFLCEMKDWEDLSKQAHKKTKGQFLFAYMLDPNKEKAECLNKFSKKLNLNLVSITDKQFNSTEKNAILDKCGVMCDASIEEFVYHLKNATYIITDSYHGMCFSIIFRKPFIALVNRSRGGSRFDTIAQAFNIGDRMVERIEDIFNESFYSQSMDYERIEGNIQREIERSKTWLNNAIVANKKTISSSQEILLEEILKLKEEIKEIRDTQKK